MKFEDYIFFCHSRYIIRVPKIYSGSRDPDLAPFRDDLPSMG